MSVNWCVQMHGSIFRVFTTSSRAVFRRMGSAMFRLGWLSLAVLYWVVSHFLANCFNGSNAHTTGELAHTCAQGNCLFKVIGQKTCQFASQVPAVRTYSYGAKVTKSIWFKQEFIYDKKHSKYSEWEHHTPMSYKSDAIQKVFQYYSFRIFILLVICGVSFEFLQTKSFLCSNSNIKCHWFLLLFVFNGSWRIFYSRVPVQNIGVLRSCHVICDFVFLMFIFCCFCTAPWTRCRALICPLLSCACGDVPDMQ